jgi:hypothetical protein
MGSSPKRGKRGKDKRRQGRGLGAAWGAARRGGGAPWGLQAARSWIAVLLVVSTVREKKKRTRKEKGEEKRKGREKKKKYGKFLKNKG